MQCGKYIFNTMVQLALFSMVGCAVVCGMSSQENLSWQDAKKSLFAAIETENSQTVSKGHLAMVRSLIEKYPALIEIKSTKDEDSPLHRAIKHSRVSIVGYLLEKRVCLMEKNAEGLTPEQHVNSLNESLARDRMCLLLNNAKRGNITSTLFLKPQQGLIKDKQENKRKRKRNYEKVLLTSSGTCVGIQTTLFLSNSPEAQLCKLEERCNDTLIDDETLRSEQVDSVQDLVKLKDYGSFFRELHNDVEGKGLLNNIPPFEV